MRRIQQGGRLRLPARDLLCHGAGDVRQPERRRGPAGPREEGHEVRVSCSVLMAEVVGATIYAASPWLIGAFSREADVIAFGVRQAHTITLFYCLLAFSHCCAGVLRGLGRPRRANDGHAGGLVPAAHHLHHGHAVLHPRHRRCVLGLSADSGASRPCCLHGISSIAPSPSWAAAHRRSRRKFCLNKDTPVRYVRLTGVSLLLRRTAKPLPVIAALDHLPRGGFPAGGARAKRRPLQGSWPSLRGLGALPACLPYSLYFLITKHGSGAVCAQFANSQTSTVYFVSGRALKKPARPASRRHR